MENNQNQQQNPTAQAPSSPQPQNAPPQQQTVPQVQDVNQVNAPTPPMNIPQPPKANKKLFIILLITVALLIFVVAGILFYVFGSEKEKDPSQDSSSQSGTLLEQAQNIKIENIDSQIQALEKQVENL